MPPPTYKNEQFFKKERAFLKEIAALRKIITSAQQWQQRSWITRALHHWRADELPPATKPTGELSAEEKLKSRLLTIFNAAHYLAQNPDAAESNLSPLEHFRTIGWKAGFNPHPLFDTNFYRQQTPELNAEPLEHYIEHGWREGRSPHRFFDLAFYQQTYGGSAGRNVEPFADYLSLGSIRNWQTCRWGRLSWIPGFLKTDPEFLRRETLRHLGKTFAPWLAQRDPAKSLVVIITPESTLTGPPRLFMELARSLREKHDVVILDMKVDRGHREFQRSCDYYAAVGTAKNPRLPSAFFVVNLLLAQCEVSFALVGSLMASGAVSTLLDYNVPVLHFIQEFATAFRPAPRHRKALGSLTCKIFPNEAVRQNALELEPKMSLAQSLVLAPVLPYEPSTEEKSGIPLRPAGWEKPVVILGAGAVESLLGVDIFFAAAARIVRANPPKSIRFVWLDPTAVTEESHFFRAELQPILRELGDAAEIIDAPTDAAGYFQSANVFFAPARIDPFPWAIGEAMHAGLPVVAFSTDLPAKCRAADLDAACAKLQTLLDSPATQLEFSQISREWAKNRFDFQSYLQSIETAVADQIQIVRRVVDDRRVILEADIIDRDFLCSPIRPDFAVDPAQAYVLASCTGIEARKAFPGFHPGIYSEKHPGLTAEPLADYLRTGRPDGPWSFEVIRPELDSKNMVAQNAAVALHIHLFYADMAEEMARRLTRNQRRVDLFVSVTSEAAAEIARKHLAGCALNRLEVASVPNRGRDIGPFFTAFGDALREYEIVGHLHTKKSLHSEKSGSVALWTEFLFENLIGGNTAMLDAILNKMIANPTLGIVYPDDPNVLGWTENRSFAESIATRLNLPQPLPSQINFPAGTFFWARTAALKKLFDQQYQWDDFPAEPLPNDGTMLHSIERLLPIVCNSAGFSTAVTHVPGLTR